MSLYPQFDPQAFLRRESGDPAKVANPANPDPEISKLAELARGESVGAKVTALEIDPVERAAICEFDGGIPQPWCDGFAKLQSMTPPASVSETRWLQVLDDCGRFLDSWGPKLAALGWSTSEVFGVHPRRPEIRRGGLIWAIRGRKIIAASEDSVAIETTTGSRQRAFRYTEPENVHVWLLG